MKDVYGNIDEGPEESEEDFIATDEDSEVDENDEWNEEETGSDSDADSDGAGGSRAISNLISGFEQVPAASKRRSSRVTKKAQYTALTDADIDFDTEEDEEEENHVLEGIEDREAIEDVDLDQMTQRTDADLEQREEEPGHTADEYQRIADEENVRQWTQ